MIPVAGQKDVSSLLILRSKYTLPTDIRISSLLLLLKKKKRVKTRTKNQGSWDSSSFGYLQTSHRTGKMFLAVKHLSWNICVHNVLYRNLDKFYIYICLCVCPLSANSDAVIDCFKKLKWSYFFFGLGVVWEPKVSFAHHKQNILINNISIFKKNSECFILFAASTWFEIR